MNFLGEVTVANARPIPASRAYTLVLLKLVAGIQSFMEDRPIPA